VGSEGVGDESPGQGVVRKDQASRTGPRTVSGSPWDRGAGMGGEARRKMQIAHRLGGESKADQIKSTEAQALHSRVVKSGHLKTAASAHAPAHGHIFCDIRTFTKRKALPHGGGVVVDDFLSARR